jgi:hypothetical protein
MIDCGAGWIATIAPWRVIVGAGLQVVVLVPVSTDAVVAFSWKPTQSPEIEEPSKNDWYPS